MGILQLERSPLAPLKPSTWCWEELSSTLSESPQPAPTVPREGDKDEESGQG